MWITKTSINNPVFATMVMVAICVLGIFSYSKLGVEQMPDIDPPVVFVEVAYPGAAPEQVENDLTKPIEDVVNTISGVRMIRSNSMENRSQTIIEFELSANMNKAVQDVRDKMATVRPMFPKEAKEPFIQRGETENSQPIAQIAILSKERSLRELSTLTEQTIVKRFQAVAGVGKVQVDGASARQILIHIKPAQMAALNVGADEVVAAIQQANQDLPAGRIARAGSENLVRVEGKMKDPRAFSKIIVARRANMPVYLEQVADVVDGEREQTSVSRVNGERAINVAITKVQDANIVKVGEGVKEAVAELRKQLPKDVELRIFYSNSDWVKGSLERVKSTILEGAGLTILIVFLFLHSWRSTIITGLTLPIAVVATFIAMQMFGFTLNFMTLMALSLCIGLLIDDAIVVRENIVRHLGMGKDHYQAARDGTQEIGLAVMATTFAIVAVFVPVAFMSGIIGKFFFQFGMTVAVAVLVSLFVSFTLDPMLSAIWPDPPEGRFGRIKWMRAMMEKIEAGIEALHHVYGRVLAGALAWRKTTLAAAFALFIGSFFLVPMIGSEFVPEVDQGYTTLRFKMPVGSSLAYTDGKVAQVERVLKEFKEIEMINTTIGQQNSNEAQIDLKLTDKKSGRDPQRVVEGKIRERLKSIPGIEMSVGWNRPVFISILGPDADKMQAIVDQLMYRIGKIKGVTDLENSLTASTPGIKVKVNNVLASELGVSLAQVGSTLRPFIAGDTISHWLAADGQNYDVAVQLPKASRESIADLENLSIASSRRDAAGNPIMVPLRQVVEFIPSSSPQVIKRQDLQRRVSIYSNVQGRPKGDVDAEVQKILKTTELPPGYRFDIGGQSKQMNETVVAAGVALGIAVIFIYLVLASQFGSFLQPIAIMVSLPFSLIGVFLALLITGSTLNIFSIIGFIMLMGLVTKNAILLVDFTNQAQREGKSQYEAIMSAGQVRLRPILMTTLAMLFGMLPMALGIGDGAEQQAPMGRAVIGGIITSTLLTLVVVPVAYTYLDNLGKWALRKFKGNAHAPVTVEAAPAA